MKQFKSDCFMFSNNQGHQLVVKTGNGKFEEGEEKLKKQYSQRVGLYLDKSNVVRSSKDIFESYGYKCKYIVGVYFYPNSFCGWK